MSEDIVMTDKEEKGDKKDDGEIEMTSKFHPKRPLGNAAISKAQTEWYRLGKESLRGYTLFEEKVLKETPLRVKDLITSLWTNIGYEGIKRKRKLKASDYEDAKGTLEVVFPGRQIPAIAKSRNKFDETDKSALIAEFKVGLKDLVLLKDAETSAKKGKPSWVYALRLHVLGANPDDPEPFICRLDPPVRGNTVDPFKIAFENSLSGGGSEFRETLRDAAICHNEAARVVTGLVPTSNASCNIITLFDERVPRIPPSLWADKKLIASSLPREVEIPPKPYTCEPIRVPIDTVSDRWRKEHDEKYKHPISPYDVIGSAADESDGEEKTKKTTTKPRKRKAAAAAAAADSGDDTQTDNDRKSDADEGEGSDDDDGGDDSDSDKKSKKQKKKKRGRSNAKSKPKKKKTPPAKKPAAKRVKKSEGSGTDLKIASNGSKWSAEYGVTLDDTEHKSIGPILDRVVTPIRKADDLTGTLDLYKAGMDLFAFNLMEGFTGVRPLVVKKACRMFVAAQAVCHELCAQFPRLAEMNQGKGIHPTQLPGWVRSRIDGEILHQSPGGDAIAQSDMAFSSQCSDAMAMAMVRVTCGMSEIVDKHAVPLRFREALSALNADGEQRLFGEADTQLRLASERVSGDPDDQEWSRMWKVSPGARDLAPVAASSAVTALQTPPPAAAAAASGGGGGGGGVITVPGAPKVPARRNSRMPAERVRRLAESNKRVAELLEEASPTSDKLKAQETSARKELESSISARIDEETKARQESEKLARVMMASRKNATRVVNPEPEPAPVEKETANKETAAAAVAAKDSDGDVAMAASQSE